MTIVEDQQQPITESCEDSSSSSCSQAVPCDMNYLQHLDQPAIDDNDESPDPPFEATYKRLFDQDSFQHGGCLPMAEEQELPLIDLTHLRDPGRRQACKRRIAKAAREWGFFQVVNHGIPGEILRTVRAEQMRLLKKPFREKASDRTLNFAQSYRWGTPTATCLRQINWLEAVHVQLDDVWCSGSRNNILWSIVEKYAAHVHELAMKLAAVLAEELGLDAEFLGSACRANSCYLRLNRYPPCRKHPYMFGIVPHTDSDFLTVLHQDDIGGLQLVKDGRWIAVKPIPDALIINIGDLFQAWSNDVYRSVEHRVVVNKEKERFSAAYFVCPSAQTVIESDAYTSFTFGEFRKKVIETVTTSGSKTGVLPFFHRTKPDQMHNCRG